jgi:hypothetical protein
MGNSFQRIEIMEIKNLSITQVRIFPPDYIAYNYLQRNDFVEHIAKKYHFQKHEMPFQPFQKGSPSVLLFNSGDYNLEGKKILIERLHFENRRIVLEAMTSSKIANKIFDAISREIRKFDPLKLFKRKDAVFESEETTCLAKLNVNYKKIYSEDFIKFIETDFASFLEQNFLEIRPKSLSFEVHFNPDNDFTKKHNINLSPKTLTIEPRSGHPLEETIFLSHSPFDSDTHFKLLENFEKTFSA